MAQNQREAALAAFRRAADQKPTDALTWAELGAAEAVGGHYVAARKAYQEALRLDPDLWIAHYNLGTLDAKEGRLAEACSHLRMGIEAIPRGEVANLSTIQHDLYSNPSFEELRDEECFRTLQFDL